MINPLAALIEHSQPRRTRTIYRIRDRLAFPRPPGRVLPQPFRENVASDEFQKAEWGLQALKLRRVSGHGAILAHTDRKADC